MQRPLKSWNHSLKEWSIQQLLALLFGLPDVKPLLLKTWKVEDTEANIHVVVTERLQSKYAGKNHIPKTKICQVQTEKSMPVEHTTKQN